MAAVGRGRGQARAVVAPLWSAVAAWRAAVVVAVPATIVVAASWWTVDAGGPAVLGPAVASVAVAPGVWGWAGAGPLAIWSDADGSSCGRWGEGLFLASGVAAVEFVRVGKGGDVFFSHRLGVLFEVGVVDCVDGVDAPPPVEAHEIFE